VAFAKQFVDQHKDFFARAAGNGLHHGFQGAGGRGADQAAHSLERQPIRRRCNCLIENRERVAHRAVAGLGQQRERIIVGFNFFLSREVAELPPNVLKLHRAKAEMLAARANGLRNIFGLRGRHHENDVAGRLFQSFEQRIEGGVGDLVGLVEDVDLEAVARWAVACTVAQFANFVDAAIGGSVNFDDVDCVAGADFGAGLAHTARLGGWFVGGTAVEGHGQNAGYRRFSDSTVAAEDVAVGDAALFDGVLQGAGDVFLADHVGEFLGTIFARQDLIAHREL